MAQEVGNRLEAARADLRRRIRDLEETFALALHVAATLVGVWVLVEWLGVSMTAVLVSGLVAGSVALALFLVWVRLQLIDLRGDGDPDGR